MKRKHGITLVALVVTIIVLLILAGVSITIMLGPNGVIKKAKESKLAARHASIVDKVKIRENDIEIANELGQESETVQEFIQRLITEGLIDDDDEYDETNIYIGKQSNGTYLFNISLPMSIKDLPDADKPGNEHLKNMTLIIEITTANQSVQLLINNTSGLTINWDSLNPLSSFEDPNLSSNPTHVYTEIGEYEVQIKGTASANTTFGKYPATSSDKYITGIKYWGENGFANINAFTKGLKGNIPVPSRKSFINVESFIQLFNANPNLTGNIPAGLFLNCPKATNFDYVFFNCSGLTGTIPSGLFTNCNNAKTFNYIFSGCIGLTGNIPSGLFANCPKVTTFNYTFKDCSGLTGNIPSGLFNNCTEVTSFVATFQKCSNLTGIPQGLFANCKKVNNFGAIFFDCINLRGNLPTDLFDNCPLASNFPGAFRNCSELTGYAPELWSRPTASGGTCFKECRALYNYEDIPANWK